MRDNRFRSAIADWLTIISTPVTIASPFVLTSPGVRLVSELNAAQRMGLALAETAMIEIFFLVAVLRIHKLIFRSKASLSKGTVLFFLVTVLGIVFLGLQMLVLPGILGDRSIALFLITCGFTWVLGGLMLDEDLNPADVKKKKLKS